MKNTRKVLSAVLALVMVLGCMTAFTFSASAEEATPVNLAPNHAESMIMITRGDKADGLAEFTDGVIDDKDAGFWTLGGGGGYYSDNLEENKAVVEAKLDASYEITAIKVGFLTPGEVYSGERYYHWEAYASNDNTLPIGEWTKIAEKKTNEIADGSGYKAELATPASYQYIRIYGVYNSCNDGSSHEGKIQMNELEIWGIDPNAGEEPEIIYPEKWTAPENGTNIIAGNTTCVVKVDRGDLPEMTDGVCGDKPSDNYWTAGSSFDPPIENPIENESTIWFQVNLDEVSEIDIIRVVALVNPEAIYHWEIYATDDPDMALEGWDFIGEKKTDEVATEDGYAIYLEEPIEAKVVRVYGTYCNLKGGDNRFRMTEIELWDVEGEVTPPEPPATETTELEGTKYGSGMENWANSTNKPEGHPAVFEIFYGAKYANGFSSELAKMAFENKDALEWTLTISENADMSDAVTKTLAPASWFDMGSYGCFRFETALAEDPWAPEVGVTYYINATVKGQGIDFAITGPADGFVMNEEPITKDYAAPTEPVSVVISPYDPEGLKGFQNWDGGNGLQTQLLICTDKNVLEGYTWVLTIVNDATGETKEITLKCATAYDTWLRRFEVCLGEGENQFVPEEGAAYTISAKIYNDEGTLMMYADPATGFVCGEAPIVPQPPVNPEPPQTGDAAIYATIAVAVAAVALAVVFKKRATI